MNYSQFDNISQYSTSSNNSVIDPWAINKADSVQPMNENIFYPFCDYIPFNNSDSYDNDSETHNDDSDINNNLTENINNNSKNNIQNGQIKSSVKFLNSPIKQPIKSSVKQSINSPVKSSIKQTETFKNTLSVSPIAQDSITSNNTPTKQDNMTKKYFIGLLLGVMCIILVDIIIKISHLKFN